MDPKAVQRFVEVTHERYKERIGESFGGVVPAIFTDEPQFSHKSTLGFAHAKEDVTLPFTDDLCDTFRAAYGEDLMAHLPELFWDCLLYTSGQKRQRIPFQRLDAGVSGGFRAPVPEGKRQRRNHPNQRKSQFLRLKRQFSPVHYRLHSLKHTVSASGLRPRGSGDSAG